MADKSGLAPSYNVPTITVSALGQSAVSTISGTPGWLREKRAGVAETAPASAGNAQTSTASLDKTGSTRFAYPGTGTSNPPFGTSSNPGQYVTTDYKPGGSAQNARWIMTVDFTMTGDTVEVRTNVASTSGRIGLLVVDGLRVQEAPLTFSSTPAAGSGAAVKLVFPDSRTRRIQMYGFNHSEGRFGGVAVASGQSVTKPGSSARTIAFVGDSYVAGAVSTSVIQTWMWQTGLRLGAEVLINAGIGSTGFDATLSGASTSNYAGRTTDVLAENPHVVVIAGARNDSTNVQATVESLLDAYASVPEVYVVPTCTDSAAQRTQMQAACTNKGRPFINISVDSYTKESDGVHLTTSEHKRFGNTVADLIAATAKAGTATGLTTITGSAAGRTTRSGSTSGTLAFTGTATGRSARNGTASGTLSWTGAASGSARKAGAATGAVSWAGSAAGKTARSGSAGGTLTTTGTATGARAARGASVGLTGYTGSSSGQRAPKASAVGMTTYAGSATGTAPPAGVSDGSASGSTGWTGVATGARQSRGVASGSTAWSGVGVGERRPRGAAFGVAAWTGAATGVRRPSATAAGSCLHTGTASGTAPALASARGVAHGTATWTATATGLGTPASSLGTPVDVPYVRLTTPTGVLALSTPTPTLALTEA